MLDPDGQPVNLAFNRARRTERDICELLGLAKGLLADGVVTEAESVLLRDWIDRHPDAYEYWPISALYQRLERAFAMERLTSLSVSISRSSWTLWSAAKPE
jgi:hypothetical protein